MGNTDDQNSRVVRRASGACGCPIALLLLALLLLSGVELSGQALVSGRAGVPRTPGGAERMPLSGVLCFAGLTGPGREPWGFRTWETEPAGWYRISGGAGNHTMVFTQPASFFRPVILNNVFLEAGDVVDGLNVTPRFNYASFGEKEWDAKPAERYVQPFIASGRAVTHVGFRVAHDGVDGMGPGSRKIRVTVHRRPNGAPADGGIAAPASWPQVGPEGIVLNVDSGGAKNYLWSVGWGSGEVPLEVGGVYAVQLSVEPGTGGFQVFWSVQPAGERVLPAWRMAGGEWTATGRWLWMAVGTDGDGLFVSYPKRVHKEYGTFAGMASRWVQTYEARGRGLASVLLSAAVSGAQPPLSRQRLVVRVREDGPEGRVVGVEKLAVGNGDYTGDASWGRFGAVFAPGEVPLVPGRRYALEWESVENAETLDGFVNIKGQVSDGRPGFNPYRKQPPDDEPRGQAYRWGTNAMDFDLDAQVIEYEHGAAGEWALELEGANLLRNGGFQLGEATAEGVVGSRIDAWTSWATDPGTTHAFVVDGTERTNRLARVLGGGWNGRTVDGGFVQRVSGLERRETYRLTGRLRSSWAVDASHQGMVGLDPTGQETNALASTIRWQVLPSAHGIWERHRSEPVRPKANSISVWLRGRTTHTGDRHAPFKVDFDDLMLRRVRTTAPEP